MFEICFGHAWSMLGTCVVHLYIKKQQLHRSKRLRPLRRPISSNKKTLWILILGAQIVLRYYQNLTQVGQGEVQLGPRRLVNMRLRSESLPKSNSTIAFHTKKNPQSALDSFIIDSKAVPKATLKGKLFGNLF